VSHSTDLFHRETEPIVNYDSSLPGGHRPEVWVANTVTTTGGGGTGTLPTAVNPQSSSVVIAALSAGSTASADSTQLGVGKVGNLLELVVASSTPVKVELRTVLNAVESANVVVFVANDGEIDWRPAAQNLVRQAQDPGVGFDGFRAYVTNLDAAFPANAYVTFFWDEV
jgi:hypothetical protein